MELFVFARMSGDCDDLVVKLLDDEQTPRQELVRRICTKFDAGKARCFADRDRQRLWAVIEASFGTFTPFNQIMKGLFKEELSDEYFARVDEMRRSERDLLRKAESVMEVVPLEVDVEATAEPAATFSES